MPTYNGYKNWNEWNAVLWLDNDESLYFYAVDLVKRYGKVRAARKLWEELKGTRTPDGARFTLKSIQLAMAGY